MVTEEAIRPDVLSSDSCKKLYRMAVVYRLQPAECFPDQKWNHGMIIGSCKWDASFHKVLMCRIIERFNEKSILLQTDYNDCFSMICWLQSNEQTKQRRANMNWEQNLRQFQWRVYLPFPRDSRRKRQMNRKSIDGTIRNCGADERVRRQVKGTMSCCSRTPIFAGFAFWSGTKGQGFITPGYGKHG